MIYMHINKEKHSPDRAVVLRTKVIHTEMGWGVVGLFQIYHRHLPTIKMFNFLRNDVSPFLMVCS